jgi:hypothetical protein
LFYTFNLDELIPERNLLRRINPIVTSVLAKLRGKHATAEVRTEDASTCGGPVATCLPPRRAALLAVATQASDVVATQGQSYYLTWAAEPVCHLGMSA